MNASGARRKSQGRRHDPRFALHGRQPRADKLDARQWDLCDADPAFKEALRRRVASEERFTAFSERSPFYVALERPCAKCGSYQKRTRDRSCYACHLNRGGENFERMKAGLAPEVTRTKDSHLDLLGRKRAEQAGEHQAATFGGIRVRRFPTGRLEVTFPDGFVEPDLGKTDGPHVHRLMEMLPELKDALRWAGWY